MFFNNKPILYYSLYCSDCSSFDHWKLLQINCCVLLIYSYSLVFFEHFLTFDSITLRPVVNLPLLVPGFFLQGLQVFSDLWPVGPINSSLWLG